MYITTTGRATLLFPNRLAIGTEAFVSLRAPINTAGELVGVLVALLVVHLFATEMSAWDLEF
jgi:hypothetical protein